MGPRKMTAVGAALLLVYGAIAGAGASASGADRRSASRPDNGRIFFSSGFLLPNPDLLGSTPQVFSVRRNGSHVRQLTHVAEGSAAGAPSVSPDGRTVAYVNNESGDFALWLMDSDGTDQRELLTTPGTDYFTPSWSPDGTLILATSCDNTIPGEPDCPLVTVGADGSGLATLVSNHRVNYSASYSPDGTKIQYSSDQAGLLGAVWIAHADGSHQRRLTDPNLDATFAAWSPDGRHLAFGDNCCRPNSNVYTIGVHGKHLRQLTHVRFGNGDANFPTYSPDGRFIVFSRIREDDFRLSVMRANGSHKHVLESSVPFAVQSSWGAVPGSAPAGAAAVDRGATRLGTSTASDAGARGFGRTARRDGRITVADVSRGVIDTVNPDGSALVQVTTPDDGFALQSTWTPDGRHLVVTAVGSDGELRLYRVAADGSGWHLLVRDRPGAADFNPKVAPDGRSVFFTRCRPEPRGGCAIAAARMNGTRRHQVTRYAPPRIDASEQLFAISHDGSRLAYGEEGLGGIADQVFISTIRGRHARPVTAPRLEAMPSDWSADGRSVLVTSAVRHLGSEILAVPARRGHHHPRLVVGTTYPRSVLLPDQSPSGASLTFIGEGDSPRVQGFLYVASSDGSRQRRIDIGSDQLNYPQWGTAPLLPASVSTSQAERAPQLGQGQLRRVRALLPTGLRHQLLPAR